MSKFEIGDKVVVVDADSVYDTYKNGDKGVVVAYDECSAMAGYVRRDGDGVLMNVYWYEVALVEEKEMETEVASEATEVAQVAPSVAPNVVPQVGDAVVGFKFKDEECEEGWGWEMEEYVGKTGMVGRVDHSDDIFSIEFGSGETWWYPLQLAHLAYEQQKAVDSCQDEDEDERIGAWYTVWWTLKEVMPDFPNLANTGEQCAVEAIKILAEAAKAPNVSGLKIDIEDIRMSRKKLQEQMKELDEKEAALIQQLKEYGFALVDENSQENVVSSAEEGNVSQLDMTNPENWEVGDFVEVCTGQYSGLWHVGDLVEIADVDKSGGVLEIITKGSKGDAEDLNAWNFYEIKGGKIKFHSRPNKET